MIEKTVGRPVQVVQAEPPPQAPHAALLVDFDNVTMGIRSDLQTQLGKLLNSDIIRGKVSVQRAYADWRRYPQYIVPLTEASIDLIFAPAVGANKKNATDIRLAIDALELVFTRPEIGTFILLSGDSDFSALVLKLKEYGKLVIGVGIRESSSDLLVQNCDEYYSYNELTGLARAEEVERVRRDPWELVVEAVQKMMRNGDVMRSDRLKQVMQSIDANFDEKDAGHNRFSKFVVEAGQRGLLGLKKMENGQYTVDLGPNANVQIDYDTPAGTKSGTSKATSISPRRKRTTRQRSEPDSKVRTLTLSESFELLKRALVAAGALGDEATVADAARKRMVEIHGNDSDPIFEAKRFQRLLRQAHDADVIELIKSDGDDYMLKLSAAAVVETKSKKSMAGSDEPSAEEQPKAVEAAPVEEESAPTPKRTTKRKSTTTRKSSRSRARAVAKETPEDKTTATADAEVKPSSEKPAKPKRKTRSKATATRKTTRSQTRKVAADDTVEQASEDVEKDSDEMAVPEAKSKPKRTSRRKGTTARKTSRTRTTAKGTNKEGSGKATSKAAVEDAPEETMPEVKAEPAPTIQSARFRTGARSVKPKPATPEQPADSDTPAMAPAKPTPKAATTRRTLGTRSGSRGAKRPAKQPAAEEEKPKLSKEAPKSDPESSHNGEPKTPTSSAALKTKPEPRESAQPPSESDGEGAGLFRKVTAAFQRAMGTVKEDDE